MRVAEVYEHIVTNSGGKLEGDTKAEWFQNFIDDWPTNRRGLLISGSQGIGKTTWLKTIRSIMQAAAYREKARKPYVLYPHGRDWPDPQRIVFQSEQYFNMDVRWRGKDAIYDLIHKSNVLFLDDIGLHEPVTYYGNTLDPTALLIEMVYTQPKSCYLFLSTNLNISKDTKGSLSARFGHRVHDRLVEMCDFLEYTNDNFRI